MDDVLIDAPYDISQEMINGLKISVVAHGKERPEDEMDGSSDPYLLPRKLKILEEIDSGSDLTVFDIEERIFKQRERFEVKFAKKKAAEDEYYSNKYSDVTTAEATEEEAPDTTTAAATSSKAKPKKTAAGKKAVAKQQQEEEEEPVVEDKPKGRPKRNAAKKTK